MEIRHAQNEPQLTVQQLLEIESCKDYVKTPKQTLDGIYVMHRQDCLLSHQLCPTFPPAWKERGAIRL